MKLALPIVAAAALLLPALAHADEKGEFILKETQLRMRNAATYSVDLQFMEAGKKQIQVRIRFQRPDKYFFGLSDKNKPEVVIIKAGATTVARQGGVSVPMPASDSQELIKTFLPFVTGEFHKLLTKPIKETRFVTQKMLDENTVVDVIDLIGEDKNDSVRVYIDNNSLIRQIVSLGKNASNTMLFVNPSVDQPLPESTFAVKN